MTKNQVEKFVNESLKDIQSGLPEGFRIDDKIHFDIARVTKGKAKGGIDIKLANIGSAIESQSIHRMKFSVVDEAAQQKSWKIGKQMITDFFSKLAQLDPENIKQIAHESSPAKKKGKAKRSKNVKK